ncbi:xanthine dehydrogenase molybdopterin binding subunit [Enterovibrio norvegicus]|uniref:xanthine dehydrogenase molybdopterin binding subunit n=1 Tax=Enterovibrio norvegicus TaxID=188144 RepID=UPI000C8659F3|nr:xanthine dehydrogenase molybdopterin binding subunit [Enterovibrio norvegicus]PMI28711.1 xanthine dehydrogenase molybdopterin binding subunit [Enterovibrio norvegicus]TKF14218.1 xanthine dehydrogenase molybdopterin binding subunit [Enterovibrio norvegicus]
MSRKTSPSMTLEEMSAQAKQDLATGVGKSVKHESAEKQVSGEALYIDDRGEFPNQLHVYALMSPHAHATITHLDVSPCYGIDGVHTVLTAEDIPGELDIGPILPGDPLLADGNVVYVGQPVIAVAADSLENARKGAQAAIIEYSELPAALDVEQALAQELFVTDSHQQKRGDSENAIANAPHQLDGALHIGGQEHFYLETQVSSVVPTEDGGVIVYCSTQNPTEVQKLVGSVLGIPMHKVLIDMRRMGGGFGGKETQAAGPACIAAVIAVQTGRPVKFRLPRREDMMMTGKRHPFYNQYKVGFNDDGLIQGIEIIVSGNAGHSPDLSRSIVDRAMFHSDNAYFLNNATVTGHCVKTNTASNTAYRGFGGPQGMMTIEHVMDTIAYHLKKDPLDVRKINYYADNERDETHYFQKVEDNFIQDMTEELEASCEYQARRIEIAKFNAENPLLKKGIALTPVKFGISFTATFLNQAGALVTVYTDGSISLNHGGTEMGQGLNTKVAQIVAETFSVDIDTIQCTATNTEKVPNTSPTAASSGTDLNGKAAQNAALTIKQRMVDFASSHFKISPDTILFSNGIVSCGDQATMTFADFVELCWFNQISLASTGFYRTPKIYYDHDAARGRPFYYFAWGVSCSEVLIDTLTGEYKVLRVDVLHDVGASLNPAIDIGQVEGGFIQGMGWLTTEELVWNDAGQLMTSGPASYKIPAVADTPDIFNVHLVENRTNPEDTVFHSKAVGEPPFMLAISVWSAIRDAVNNVSENGEVPYLAAPATPEQVYNAIKRVRKGKRPTEFPLFEDTLATK